MEIMLVLGVVAFLVVMGLYGYSRGIINIVLSVVAMSVTSILAVILAAPVGAMVKATTPIYDNIYDKVYEEMKEQDIVDISGLDDLGLPEAISKNVKDNLKENGYDVDEKVDDFIQVAAKEVANAIFKSGIFLVLFIIIYIAVKILIHLADFVAKLPLIKEANKLGGCAFGVVFGIILVWVGCILLTAFSNHEWAKDMMAAINDNALLSFIYNNNFVSTLIGKCI